MVILKVEDWKRLILKCLKAHFHPTILFYRVIDPNVKEFVKNSDDIIPTFSTEEWRNILSNCQSIDEMNEKKTDYLDDNQSRLNLKITKTRPYDSESFRLIKETNLKNPQTEDNLEMDMKIDEKIISSDIDLKKFPNSLNIKINSNEKEVENGTKIAVCSKIQYRPAEDEWICENEKCQNVNKIDSHQCLSKIFIFNCL